jgi:hypothetical protein
MTTSILISTIAACALCAPIVSAQEKPAPKPAMSLDMEKQASYMQDKMKAMQAQMDTIHKTTDADQRRKLMQEHLQAMQENMEVMRGMGGPLMKGRGEHGAIVMCGNKGGMTDGDMIKCREIAEIRMDMMQMMMEQMMQRDPAAKPMGPR